MAKRFIDTSKHRQAWRKLDPKLRAAFYWITENCDAAGYWIIDLEHFKFECGYALDVDRFIKETGAAEKHGTGTLRMIDFIETNYGALKEGYNPHKPALRALASHQISSLSQASTKLEDEEEGEEEDTQSSGKERAHVAEVMPPGMSAEMFAALKRWEQYRKERKSKLTPSGRAALIKKFMDMGDDRAIAAIEHSMAQGWAGVFEPNVPTTTNAKNKSDEQYRNEVIEAARQRFGTSVGQS